VQDKFLAAFHRQRRHWHFLFQLSSIGKSLIRYRPRNDGKDERTLKELAVLNTTYGEIARHVIWGDMATRDITNWLETCNTTQILIK